MGKHEGKVAVITGGTSGIGSGGCFGTTAPGPGVERYGSA